MKNADRKWSKERAEMTFDATLVCLLKGLAVRLEHWPLDQRLQMENERLWVYRGKSERTPIERLWVEDLLSSTWEVWNEDGVKAEQGGETELARLREALGDL